MENIAFDACSKLKRVYFKIPGIGKCRYRTIPTRCTDNVICEEITI